MLVFHAHFENCKEKCCRNKQGLIEWEKDKKSQPTTWIFLIPVTVCLFLVIVCFCGYFQSLCSLRFNRSYLLMDISIFYYLFVFTEVCVFCSFGIYLCSFCIIFHPFPSTYSCFESLCSDLLLFVVSLCFFVVILWLFLIMLSYFMLLCSCYISDFGCSFDFTITMFKKRTLAIWGHGEIQGLYINIMW